MRQVLHVRTPDKYVVSDGPGNHLSRLGGSGLRGGEPDESITLGGITVYLGGDIIVGIAGTEVRTIQDFYAALEPTSPGDDVKVEIIRGQDTHVVNVVLAERPERLGW